MATDNLEKNYNKYKARGYDREHAFERAALKWIRDIYGVDYPWPENELAGANCLAKGMAKRFKELRKQGLWDTALYSTAEEYESHVRGTAPGSRSSRQQDDYSRAETGYDTRDFTHQSGAYYPYEHMQHQSSYDPPPRHSGLPTSRAFQAAFPSHYNSTVPTPANGHRRRDYHAEERVPHRTEIREPLREIQGRRRRR